MFFLNESAAWFAFASPPPFSGRPGPPVFFVPSTKQVMISNLDYSLTEKDVEEFCSAAGAVAGVKLVKKWYAKTSKG